MYSCEFNVKKLGWGGAGVRTIKFVQSLVGDQAMLTTSSKILTVSIGPGLSADTSKFVINYLHSK